MTRSLGAPEQLPWHPNTPLPPDGDRKGVRFDSSLSCGRLWRASRVGKGDHFEVMRALAREENIRKFLEEELPNALVLPQAGIPPHTKQARAPTRPRSFHFEFSRFLEPFTRLPRPRPCQRHLRR